jgi:general secretion pathway protein G
MKNSACRAGFTLIELIVVVSILVILAGALIPRVTNRMAAARDAQRLTDIRTIKNAIDQYFTDKGTYPAANQNAAFGGWDVSQDGDFIPTLFAAGYLKSIPKDPINDDTYQYRYYLYDKGIGGCKGDTPFYVLGVRAFETADMALKNTGYFQCASRNWGTEFAYVTGGGVAMTTSSSIGG